MTLNNENFVKEISKLAKWDNVRKREITEDRLKFVVYIFFHYCICALCCILIVSVR